MDINDLEDKLGGMSLYQLLSIISAAWLIFSTAVFSQTGVFYNAVPQHRCFLSDFTNETMYGNFTEDSITAFAIPPGDSCHRYVYNSSECLIGGDFSCLINASENGVTECDNGYYYDKKYFEKTIISEWDLVCSKQIWVAILNSLFFIGVFFGSPPVGYISDRFGRKASMIVILIGVVASGLGCTFSPNLAVYCVFRFLEGATTIPIIGVAFTYANELSSKKWRLYVGAAMALAPNISLTLLPVIALFLRDWRDLNLCVALLPVIFLIVSPFIPETPRWLFSKYRSEQAKEVVDRIARSKRKTIDDNDWKLIVETEKTKMSIQKSSSQLTDLFKLPFMRIVTLILMFNWAAVNCVFYGLVLNVATLSGDLYVNAILNAATQIVATFPYTIITAKKGPRIALIIGTSVSGVFCLIAMIAGEFQNNYNSSAVTEIIRWTSIIGKLFASIAFFSAYQYTNDVVPTATRGKAMGLSSMSARIGSIIVPFVLIAQRDAKWVVQALFGIVAISSALLTMLLPDSETLTTTVEEAEKYYNSNMNVVSKILGKSHGSQLNNGRNNDGYKRDEDPFENNDLEVQL